MNKIAIFLTTVLITGFVTLKMMDTPFQELPYRTQDQDQDLHHKLIAYRCFKTSLETAIEDLGKGKIRLKEARTHILASARRNHPEFLANIKYSEPGNTDEERIAHNLVGHAQSIAEVNLEVLARLPALENELQDLLTP